MNERIKELAHQAEFISKRHNGDEWRWGYIDPELNSKLEKFAELIVRECAEVAANVVADREGVDFGLVEKCYEHFGVEL